VRDAQTLKGGEVVTWGAKYRGGNSTSVAERLASGVTFIYSQDGAFAALKEGGEVVTWGDEDCGGDSTSVARRLVDALDLSAASKKKLSEIIPSLNCNICLSRFSWINKWSILSPAYFFKMSQKVSQVAIFV